MGALVTRFAPSPTGYLHLGHAASAWHVWTEAERLGADVLLRIEDIDTTRCRPEYTEAIYEDLAWLGFTWPEPVRIQSEHFPDYAGVVDALARRGLAYRCFRTRSEIAELTADDAPFSGGPLPDAEEARRLAAGEPFAWRLSLERCRETLGAVWNELSYRQVESGRVVTQKAEPSRHGDIVIARKDSPSAYHVAATHDDAVQGVTHVIRGKDLIDAPHIHTLLQALMDWPQPLYIHHELVLDERGQRLSKTDKSVSLRDLRADGVRSADIWGRLNLA